MYALRSGIRGLAIFPLVLLVGACDSAGGRAALPDEAAPSNAPLASALSTGDAPSHEPRPRPASAYDREILGVARAEEDAHLAANGRSGVVRTGWDLLTITARDGTRRVFADSLEDGNLQWVYVFLGRPAPLEAFVVERRHVPAGWDFMLIEMENGRTTPLDVPPVASPDGRRFVTANEDLVTGYLPNRIRVYRMEPTGPVLEWEHEPQRWGVRSAVWESERRIRLAWSKLVDDQETEPQPDPLFLELGADGWTLPGEAPPSDG
jgi:hypothetical protein